MAVAATNGSEIIRFLLNNEEEVKFRSNENAAGFFDGKLHKYSNCFHCDN